MASLPLACGPMWQVVLTGIFTLLGAATGAVTVQSYMRAEAQAQRVEARRAEFRSELVTLTTDMRQWLATWEVLVPAYARMTVKDLMEFVDTDTGRESRERMARIEASLDRLHLLVGEETLIEVVDSLRSLVTNLPKLAMHPVVEREGQASPELIGKSLAYVDAANTELARLQNAAAPILRVDFSPPRSPWARFRRTTRRT